MLWYVCKQVVCYIAQRTVLYFWDGDVGADKVFRGRLGEAEERPLQPWVAKLAVYLTHGILIVLCHACLTQWAYEVVRRRSDLARKSFDLARLRGVSVVHDGKLPRRGLVTTMYAPARYPDHPPT